MQIWAAGKSVMQVTTKSSSSRDTPPLPFPQEGASLLRAPDQRLPAAEPPRLHFLPARWTIHKKRPPPHKTGPAPAPHPVSQTRAQQVLAAQPPTSFAIRANELRVVFESEEKARPAYGKSPKGFFHRLQGFFRAVIVRHYRCHRNCPYFDSDALFARIISHLSVKRNPVSIKKSTRKTPKSAHPRSGQSHAG